MKSQTSIYHQGTMPTFNKAFKEVGIVPISIIWFMENRHKFTKKDKRRKIDSFVLIPILAVAFLGGLGVLVVKEVLCLTR